jgi:hypothetical protein
MDDWRAFLWLVLTIVSALLLVVSVSVAFVMALNSIIGRLL